MQPLELLAPARDIETAFAAIAHGADAVYIGGPSHGARAAACNSVDDIRRLTDYAHTFGVRVYVTLNTIIRDNELKTVEATVYDLYRAHADALIVQDMALLRLDLPPIDLHASTQCDIRTPEKAAFLARCGFSQIVLPREFSLDEIEAAHRAAGPDIVIEAFVHGALCVSYSGDCQASFAACGRSANRGECAQMCRLPYNLTDAQGNILVAEKHLLSLRDLNRLHDIARLAEAGVSSFKIEGRLKDAAYVKTVTLAYRRAIDKVITDKPDIYCRSSWGETESRLQVDTDRVFNRGFTSYFIDGRPDSTVKMASINSPKWTGLPVATVISSRNCRINVRPETEIANGDGLGFFDTDGRYSGFRINRAEGNVLHTSSPVRIAPGTILYRNNDTALAAMLSGATASRKIAIDMRLSLRGNNLSLSLSDSHGHSATACTAIEQQTARSTQKESRRKAITKLGDTPLSLRSISDYVPDDTFIPLSLLSSLRRNACDLFISQIKATYTYRYRRPEDMNAAYTHSLTYHDNVANKTAERFYTEHGATVAQRAKETSRTVPTGTTVMTTRYCLRRELGACLLTPGGSNLPQDLFLTNRQASYALKFDCRACRMHLLTAPTPGKPK